MNAEAFRAPVTDSPGTIIGYRRNGQPIRLIAGGSQAATEAPPVPAEGGAPQPSEPAAPQQQPAAPAAPAQPAPVPSPPPQPRQSPEAAAQPAQAPAQPAEQPGAPAEDVATLKAERDTLREQTAKLEAEAARWKQMSRAQEQRSKANHAELKNRDALLREIAAKVGVEFDDRPDPEELSRRLDQASATARQKSVELAVYTTAATAGANAAALLDSRDFMGRTAGLDPDAADFSAQVADLVREAAQQERYQVPKPPPVLAPAVAAPAPAQPPAAPPVTGPPAVANGADFSGAPGGNRKWTQADYDHYMATANTEDRDGTKFAKAIQDGLLEDLGIGRPKHRSYGR
jgi:hypothetical protein